MGKKSKSPKILRDDQGEFRWETYFVHGKEKKRKLRLLDGNEFDYDEFIRTNADDIWLKQNGEYEILNEREMERKRIEEQGAETKDANQEPF